MQALVMVADVAVLGERFGLAGNDVEETSREYELNEWDEYALEEAVRLREDGVVSEVVTVTLGPPRSEEVIRKALAKGADGAIRIWDESLTEATLKDPAVKARLLAGVVAEESPDLVLAGVQTGDEAFGATGVMLATRLEYGWAAVVNELTVESDEALEVRRELEGGIQEVARIDLPAVCTIQTGINEPRYASLRGIRMAQQTTIEVRTLADLGLEMGDLASSISLVDTRRPEKTGRAELFEGDPGEAAEQLAAFLKERGVGA